MSRRDAPPGFPPPSRYEQAISDGMARPPEGLQRQVVACRNGDQSLNGDIMNKWIAGVLQVLAAPLFVAAGAEDEALIFPAAITQLTSLALLHRRPKRRESLPELQDETLRERLDRMEHGLLGLQADVGNLRDSREFMEELYDARGACTGGGWEVVLMAEAG